MKKSYILPLFAAAMLATGCSKENPFEGYGSGTEGQILKSALSVEVDADGLDVRVTRAAEARLDDFNIIFTAVGESQPAAKYTYGSMPEIVTLHAGTYICTATYGENRDADWENPHFLGTSDEIVVNAMEITSYVEPILCHLENVKVTIDFSETLRPHISDDTYVEVKVGHSSSLRYGLDEALNAKAGYFKLDEERTLVAEFHGKVDGADIIEVKSLQDIEKGTHYKITFKLHESSNSEFTGDADVDGVVVDASVDATDVNLNVPLIEDEILEDTDRPVEGDEPSVDEPVQPDDPASPKPDITSEDVKLGQVTVADDLSSCVLYINSYHEDGITGLTCDIDSPVLTYDVLDEIGLDTHLDLVDTPESMQLGLSQLNLPYNVRGDKKVVFDISGFIGILGTLSDPGMQHKFTITVTDANGTCSEYLILKYTR